jgi:hypothetical protein
MPNSNASLRGLFAAWLRPDGPGGISSIAANEDDLAKLAGKLSAIVFHFVPP